MLECSCHWLDMEYCPTNTLGQSYFISSADTRLATSVIDKKLPAGFLQFKSIGIQADKARLQRALERFPNIVSVHKGSPMLNCSITSFSSPLHINCSHSRALIIQINIADFYGPGSLSSLQSVGSAKVPRSLPRGPRQVLVKEPQGKTTKIP